MPERISDPIDRIVRLVISQIGRTRLDDVAKGYTIERVTNACRRDITSEFNLWVLEEIREQEETRRNRGTD